MSDCQLCHDVCNRPRTPHTKMRLRGRSRCSKKRSHASTLGHEYNTGATTRMPSSSQFVPTTTTRESSLTSDRTEGRGGLQEENRGRCGGRRIRRSLRQLLILCLCQSTRGPYSQRPCQCGNANGQAISAHLSVHPSRCEPVTQLTIGRSIGWLLRLRVVHGRRRAMHANCAVRATSVQAAS